MSRWRALLPSLWTFQPHTRAARTHFQFMLSPSLPELVARAREHPFWGAHEREAIARYGETTITSAYEPIFDVGTHSFPQVLSASPESAERFGDELGAQAITLIEGNAPNDPFAQMQDNRPRARHARPVVAGITRF